MALSLQFINHPRPYEIMNEKILQASNRPVMFAATSATASSLLSFVKQYDVSLRAVGSHRSLTQHYHYDELYGASAKLHDPNDDPSYLVNCETLNHDISG